MTDRTDLQSTVKGWKCYVIIELPVMLMMFVLSMAGSVFTDLVVYRTCVFTLNVNETECLLLRHNSSSPDALKLEGRAEPYVTLILMVKSVLENIIPAFLSLFMGSWSHKHGRRPLLLSSAIGCMMMYGSLALSCEWDMNPWFFVVTSVPYAILGGMCPMMLGALCHIYDITDEKNRTTLLAWLQVVIFIGIVGGIFGGPLIYEAYGYRSVFITAASITPAILLYIYFFVPETITHRSTESRWNFFKVSHVKDMLDSCISKRHGFNRMLVWSVILSITFGSLVMQGEMNVDFLFTRERLGWDIESYSYYNATKVVLNIVGVFIGVSLLGNVLGFSDTLLAILTSALCVAAGITKSLTFQPWHIYLSAVLDIFRGVFPPVIRAFISKSVSSEDIGNIFSLTTSLETMSPLAAAPLYTIVYSRYLPPIYPSPVWLLTAGFYSAMLLQVIYMRISTRKMSREISHGPLIQEDK